MEPLHCYALVAGIGLYEEDDMSCLPAGRQDALMLQAALVEGLGFLPDRIRMPGAEDGRVSLRDFARAMQEFSVLLTGEDLFVLYVSGHGNASSLHFTDGKLSLQSLMSYLERMPAQKKILILDTCQAGALAVPERELMKAGDLLKDLAGKGTALMASSAAGEEAWIAAGSKTSVFTEAVCFSMRYGRSVRGGDKTLFSVMEFARTLMEVWNREHREHAQHPVFRSDMIGTVTFSLGKDKPDEKAKVALMTDRYELYDVRSISTASMRRLTAFFICGEDLTEERLAAYTLEAAEVLKNCAVAKNDREKAQFQGTLARAVWCYFGKDVRDMEESCFMGFGLWTADQAARELLCRGKDMDRMHEGIYVCMNPAYRLARRQREETVDRKTYEEKVRMLLSVLVSGAEAFIEGLHAMENGELLLTELKERVREWTKKVLRAYIACSDVPAAEEELRAWGNAVFELADWAMDLSLPLSEEASYDETAVRWLLQHAAERYYAAIQTVRIAEEKCRICGDHLRT